MADSPASQYSPELSQAMLDQIQKQIERQRQQQIAEAQGAAVTRGITGGSFEANGIGKANMGAQDASTQAALDIAIKNADYVNNQKQIEQQQTFQAGESEKNRLFGTSERQGTEAFTASQTDAQQKFADLEQQKQEAFAAGQTDKAQSFQAQQDELQRTFQTNSATTAYERQKTATNSQNRSNLLNTGIQTVGQIAGGVVALFCFTPQTLVEMLDGELKFISAIQIGDVTKGGTVLGIRQVLASPNTIRHYKGIYVVGSHEVKENGIWKRVEDCMDAVPTSLLSNVYNLITSKQRIFVRGMDNEVIEFMDENPRDTSYSLEELNHMEVVSNGK